MTRSGPLPSQPILIVDDEENIRLSLRLFLTSEGYTCLEAEDGEKAWEILTSTPVFALLCDVRMPSLDGLGLLQRIRTSRTAADVIMMSAYGSEDLALEAVRAGAWDYLNKPIRFDALRLMLMKLVEHRRLEAAYAALLAQEKGEGLEGILGRSPCMQRVFTTIRKVAEYPTTVLIDGESGTGKEMVARAIHQLSPRSDSPFLAVNCGALPESLIESELFGHARGAFTDARQDKVGLVEAAHQGTLFLDEIADLPLSAQVKLLRVLQEGTVRRVGENRDRVVDVRVIAASARPLRDEVDAGRFRDDLFYRLHVLRVHLPPLRERPEDIPLLASHFLDRLQGRLGRKVRGFAPQTMSLLQRWHWPGNVRELHNVVERLLVLSDGDALEPDGLPDAMRSAGATSLPGVQVDALPAEALSLKVAIAALERAHIARALELTEGNRTAAARLLEISPRALHYKLREYFPQGDV